MTARADHVLVISIDELMVHTAKEDGETVDPMDREFWNIYIRCEADPDDFGRLCVTWYECGCRLTADQMDELAGDGEGPCPKSPTGVHRPYVGELSVARPSWQCWAVVCDDAHDAANDLADKHNLGPGEYRVHVHPSHEYVEFELETVASAPERAVS
jgi:hypothetical protein